MMFPTYPTERDAVDLVKDPHEPAVTVYLPLETGVPQVKQNPSRRRQAIQAVETSLESFGARPDAVSAVSRQLAALDVDVGRLPHPTRALAAFVDGTRLRVFALSRPRPLQVSVGRSFRIRPILQAARHERRYRVLALSANRVALYDGDPRTLREASRGRIPESLEAALGSDVEGEALQYHSGGRGEHAIFHGHGGSSDERGIDRERFHRVVARAVHDHLKADDQPLVLVADKTHHAEFTGMLKLPQLLEPGVAANPDHFSADELHRRAWEVVDGWVERQDRESLESYEQARNRGKATDRLADLSLAAVSGRIRRLWVGAEREMPGRLDEEGGRFVEPVHEEDALDELAAVVLRRGGEVIVVPDEDGLPATATGAAAELR